MAKRLHAATILFGSVAFRNERDCRQRVLRELDEKLAMACDRGFGLVVTSEGVESLAQTMDQAESLDRPGEVLSRYRRFARSQRCVVAGSVKLEERGRIYNAMAFIGPDGEPRGRYFKTYLTDGELEMGLTPGSGAGVVDTEAGRFGGAICFDLNFRELCDAYASQRPDVICFASMYHGGLMQSQWAYACRSFFIAALPFHGGAILNPLGQSVTQTDCYNPIAEAVLELDRAVIHLDFNREKFPDMLRRYGRQISLEIPANIGSAILSGLDPNGPTAMEIVEREQLLLLDDYLTRSRSRNAEARDLVISPSQK